MIKQKNFSNSLNNIEKLLLERYDLPKELMNASEFFSRTDQLNFLLLKALQKCETRINELEDKLNGPGVRTYEGL